MKNQFHGTKVIKPVDVKTIYTIHYQALLKNYVSTTESHPFWEFIYADKGNIDVKVENETYNLNRGESVFIAPNLTHCVISGNNEPNIFIISFGCQSRAMSFFNDKKIKIGDKNKYLLQEIVKESDGTFIIPEFNPDLHRLKIKKNANFGGVTVIADLLETFIIILLRGMDGGDSPYRFLVSAETDDNLKESIIKYLSEHIYDNISLKDVCDAFHYKKAWLCSYFLRETGTQIYKTYIKMKMDEAKKLIRQNYTFGEISDKLCYDNPAYFSASFKKYVGMTPGDYKKSIK